jgi:hypothetical protein
MEVERVQELPNWSKKAHCDVECGRCGCNCGNGSLCPGIPIASEFRYERIEQKSWPENRKDVPDGEGYQMSGGLMINVNRFCEPCFERLVGLELMDREDYTKVSPTTLFDEVTNEMLTNTGRYHQQYDTPTFFQTTEIESWYENNNVDSDDAAAVIANALISPDCKYEHLDIAALHFNDNGFGEKGLKAMAYAISINTSLKSIVFAHEPGECCCDRYVDGYDVFNDASNGLLLKALKHNKSTSLERLVLCPVAFGEETEYLMKQYLVPRS